MNHCLCKAIGQARLSYDELLTAVVEAEAVINSRPLTYVSMNGMEEPLTPAHLYTGQRVLSFPDGISHGRENIDDVELDSSLLICTCYWSIQKYMEPWSLLLVALSSFSGIFLLENTIKYTVSRIFLATEFNNTCVALESLVIFYPLIEAIFLPRGLLEWSGDIGVFPSNPMLLSYSTALLPVDKCFRMCLSPWYFCYSWLPCVFPDRSSNLWRITQGGSSDGDRKQGIFTNQYYLQQRSEELIAVLMGHLKPKPLVTTEHFKFHYSNQCDGEIYLNRNNSPTPWLQGVSEWSSYMTDWYVN